MPSGTATTVALAVVIPVVFLILLAILAASIITGAILYNRHKKRGRLFRLEAHNQMMCSLTESTDGNEKTQGLLDEAKPSSHGDIEQSGQELLSRGNGVVTDNVETAVRSNQTPSVTMAAETNCTQEEKQVCEIDNKE